MEQANSKLTVYFEDPFWVGIFERETDGRYQACKVTFGAEPRDWEVYAFILSRRYEQLSFSPSTVAETAAGRRLRPKRAQKAAARQLEERGAGTKAQQALQLQREQNKQARKVRSRENREAEQARRFTLRREKRKEKHRGH